VYYDARMRGDDEQTGHLFSYLSPVQRVPADHPLRAIRRMTDEALVTLSRTFDRLYADTGRPSIPPEQLLRALLVQALYTVRSERLLIEQLQYNLLFRWFVGLSMDIRCGTQPRSPRTGSGCSPATWRRDSSTRRHPGAGGRPAVGRALHR
jgi:hypothetical protein